MKCVEKICSHLIAIGHFMLFQHSIDQYFHDTRMDWNCTWGTDIEILTFAHLTNTNVHVYRVDTDIWNVYGPGSVD